jgi:hypothetical protein
VIILKVLNNKFSSSIKRVRSLHYYPESELTFDLLLQELQAEIIILKMQSFLILMLTCMMVVVAFMGTEAEEARSGGHHRVVRSPYHVLYGFGRVRNRINSVILINYTN